MREFVSEQGIFIFVIVLFMLLSAGCQIIIAVSLVQLLKESENLEEGNPKLLRDWLEHYMKEEKQIANMEVFVDKSLQNFRIKKFTLLQIKHMAGQLLLFAIFIAGTGACKGIIEGKTLGQILPFYILCLAGLYVHFSLSGIMDMEEKKKIIKTNMIDFLENRKPYLCAEIKEAEETKTIEPVQEYFGEKEEEELKELLREILA